MFLHRGALPYISLRMLIDNNHLGLEAIEKVHSSH
jgi:hypothetical protein